MSTDDLSVRALRRDAATVLAVSGVLDSRTYLTVRDAIVKAATDAPDCLVVDVRALDVPTASAWSVLTSAAWLIRDWPNVPVAVVADPARLDHLVRSGITRYVPAYRSLDAALDHVTERRDIRVTHRARTVIPRHGPAPLDAARGAVVRAVEDWNPDFVRLARLLTTILVGNVLRHTHADPDIRVEVHGTGRLVVAVSDDSPTVPVRVEDTHGDTPIASGLAVLALLSRHWGYTPTGNGKTVWAVVGAEEVARFDEPDRQG
ncbi:hypothetical protein [Gordonia lacunae]|uniref:Sulfate transporter n=1 Tax=Gordonia lacunae TaxID=417102 RepID=A0A243QE43_9ACTN|nr:hypothetical protein [Gordonia lacunae]OUC80002.1 hypothetical protein CA982_04675 [Gordonia lacunae]